MKYQPYKEPESQNDSGFVFLKILSLEEQQKIEYHD